MNEAFSDPAGGAPLHVLEVIGNAIVGGMETWVERFIERMPRSQFSFTALCPTEGPFAERLRAQGVEVFIVPMADDPSWTSIQTTIALVNARGIDLLHAHLPRAHVLAGIAGRLTGRPVLATVHGRQLQMLDLEVYRTLGSHLSVVCRPSYFSALGLGVSPERLSCDTNGVDTAVFRPQRPATSALRAALGLAPQTPLIGFVGRLSPEKGPEVFVRACLLLQQRQAQAHCVVAGEGPMLAELLRLSEQLGLTQRLHFLGLREDMAALYNELDVVVSSSHSEAMPLALMEAMASGLPIVATRVGGVPELVEHGVTGWLVAPGDFNDIAGRCAVLASDPELRRRMGSHGRQRATERFDLGDGAARVGRLIRRLVNSARCGPEEYGLPAPWVDQHKERA
ncbi:MAG: glycosyltransferase [Burkholderiales bacterium]|nr:glycosyltransferase [Burkholderiales bacterium]